MKLHNERKNYQREELLENTISKNPFSQFEKWFLEAKNSSILEANVMTLATATLAGKPSARILLLKEFSEKGFVFFTNYSSRKGEEIHQNPSGQLLFFWDILEKQVRIEGMIEKISVAESKEYFLSRPLESQLGAISSPQSQPIESREILEKNLEIAKTNKVEKPENWGGYRLVPTYFEFWQGRPSRLHDRIFYNWENNVWRTGRLAP